MSTSSVWERVTIPRLLAFKQSLGSGLEGDRISSGLLFVLGSDLYSHIPCARGTRGHKTRPLKKKLYNDKHNSQALWRIFVNVALMTLEITTGLQIFVRRIFANYAPRR